MPIHVQLGPDDDGRRLDRILRKTLQGLPLSAIHRLFRTKKVLQDGIPVSISDRARSGSVLEIQEIKEKKVQSERSVSPNVKQLDHSWIVYEGAGLLCINKAAGLAVHGKNSLDLQVKQYLSSRLNNSVSFKPGPLHRLDQPTSGIICFSTNLDGARQFSQAMRERRITKRYMLIVQGLVQSAIVMNDLIERDHETKKSRIITDTKNVTAKEAQTILYPLDYGNDKTLCVAEIRTGRTHQIRAQTAALGFPILGDTKYSKQHSTGVLCLHAYELQFPENFLSEVPRKLRAPLNSSFMDVVLHSFGEKTYKSLCSTPPTEQLLGVIL